MNQIRTYITIFFTLFAVIVLGQPGNDDCGSAATVVDLDGTCNTYNNSGSTLDAAPNNIVGSCFTETNTSWFQFTAQGNEVTVDISSSVNKFNPEVVIFGDTDGDICDGTNTFELDCAIGGTGNYGTISVTSYPLTVGNTYWVMIVSDSEGNYDICVDNPVNAPGDNCLAAEPFCTDNTQTFDAATNTTAIDNADYGCLLTQPNPKWFYLEIDQAGDIDITMNNTNTNDIDFALWGPVTDVATGCATDIVTNSPLDCSYSIAATETASITGASVGETYIMVITNFDNTPTTISFSQTGGTGGTDCGITLPVNLISFKGTANLDYNLIEWETASENNNSHFLVQHSSDGQSWSSLAEKNGSGTTFTNSYYNVRHANPQRAINYYRLVQVDYDGDQEIHGPVAVDNLQDVKITKIVNIMGQVVNQDYSGVVIFYYSNGQRVKRVQ